MQHLKWTDFTTCLHLAKIPPAVVLWRNGNICTVNSFNTMSFLPFLGMVILNNTRSRCFLQLQMIETLLNVVLFRLPSLARGVNSISCRANDRMFCPPEKSSSLVPKADFPPLSLFTRPGHFTILEPSNQEICGFYVVQKRGTTDFKA